ncbi:ABC transporter substrate-binding protein [Rhodovulum visakhapatnamense]|uniref:Peptide/nickel transport system substrate-binding protein n=1 Tax=Rhodovulum visakhapatnamense TaxID=364297 RepID=A0A4R8G137_9RHOB|nr:ABC transporter substrate-binding protein [Rhodovulum visakhapatnamense]TDX30175.1 peptide/nickel transport system substrate-binding protein [Rhodovulum visakhapatnamense]
MRPLSFLALAVSLSLPLAAEAAPPLVLAVGGEPETGFDPIMGWGRYGNPLFQATLLRREADLSLAGDLATGWTLSDDRLTWTITLRDDARFSDGTRLSAEDVAFTFNAARDGDGLTDLKVLKEARATGPLTVELELRHPQITFTGDLATLGIVPKASYGPDYARHPVGAGPFRLVEWREGEQLIVAPNPYWHGPEIPFPRVTFVFGAEAAGLALARTGAAQIVAVPPAEADAAPEGMQVLHVPSVDNRGVMFPMRPAGGTTAEGAPIGNDVTADRAIRVAVDQAVDRTALLALAVNGHGAPAHGPADGLPWDNPADRLSETGPDAARATLESAGWTDADGDGLREKGGLKAQFQLVYPASDSVRQALALGVAEALKPVGIRAIPDGRSWDEIGRLMHSEPVVFGWGSHDPSEVFNLYESSLAGRGWYNPGFYANPAVDAHFAAAEASESYEASLPEWRAAQWDGTTGFGAKGDAAWTWLINIDHSYWVSDCLDLGPIQTEPHGHGWPITQGLPGWRWTCE